MDLQEESLNEKILINNENFVFVRERKNNYRINCVIENNNINVEKLFNFNLLQFMYSINKNLFEIIDLDIKNDNEANLYLLIKPIFKSLGFYQRFISLNMIKSKIGNSIIFNGQIDKEYGILKNNCKQAIMSPVTNAVIKCTPIHSGKFELVTYLKLDENFKFPIMIEKIIGTLLKKVYKNIMNISLFISVLVCVTSSMLHHDNTFVFSWLTNPNALTDTSVVYFVAILSALLGIIVIIIIIVSYYCYYY